MHQRANSRFDGAVKAYMLLLIGCTIFADKIFTLLDAKYLSISRDLARCGRFSWGQLHLSHSTYI